MLDASSAHDSSSTDKGLLVFTLNPGVTESLFEDSSTSMNRFGVTENGSLFEDLPSSEGSSNARDLFVVKEESARLLVDTSMSETSSDDWYLFGVTEHNCLPEYSSISDRGSNATDIFGLTENGRLSEEP